MNAKVILIQGGKYGKENWRLWSLILLVISIVSIVFVVCNLLDIDLSDAVVRILGILDICALPVLIYASFSMHINKEK